jgi:hypothetical protein
VREWSVLILKRAPQGTRGSLTDDDARVDDFLEALAPWSPTIAVESDSWSVRMNVPAKEPHEAIEQAQANIGVLSQQCRFPAWPVGRVEAVDVERLVAELEESNLPYLVGTTEVAGMLEISRQRIHELRKAGRFPEPLIELAAGPIWLRATISSFNRQWVRAPGRPRAHRPTPRQEANGTWVAHCPGCGGNVGVGPPLTSEIQAQQLADSHEALFHGKGPSPNDLPNLFQGAHGNAGKTFKGPSPTR